MSIDKLPSTIRDIAIKLDVAKTLFVEYPDSEYLLFEALAEAVSSCPELSYFNPIICWDFSNKFQVLRWNAAIGVDFVEPTEADMPGWAAFRTAWEGKRGPINLLGGLSYLAKDFRGGGLVVMLDAMEYVALQNDAGIATRRLIKDVVSRCLNSGYEGDEVRLDKRVRRMRVIIAGSQHITVPQDLKIYTDTVRFGLPKAEDILHELQQQMAVLVDHGIQYPPYSDPIWTMICRSALSLTLREVGDTFREAVLTSGVVDASVAQALYQRKVDNAKEAGLIVPDPPKNPVGGLSALKEWLRIRQAFIYDEGDMRPKGILAVGPPGTGKSQLAKVIAQQFGLTLFLLQPDAIFGSLVGESEGKLRRILELAEANAPCILWVDEAEQLFGGGSINDVSNKVTGMLLTWMQEQSKVFVLMTANDVSPLPAQMLRRFDEIFLVDLPTFKARKQIFRIHLQRYAPDLPIAAIEQFSAMAAAHTPDYSGAEIEKAVKSAVMACHLAGHPRTVDLETLKGELDRIVPLARQESDRIDAMRQAASRFLNASGPDEADDQIVSTQGSSRSIGVRRRTAS